jgi:hypothetical protein
MLRPFPPINASRVDLIPFETDSDLLLRSVSSSFKPFVPEPSEPYDDTTLGDLTNLSSELLGQITDIVDQASQSESVPKFDSDSALAKAGLQAKAKSGDKSDGFILKMIFDIVPIGVNIAKKGKTIATGFKETSMGIVNLIKNIALLTAVIGMDTIEFFIQLFVYLFKLLLCSVTIISNFPKCITFYIIDVIMFVIFVIIVSLLFIIDIFLMVKTIAGISCIEAFIMLLGILNKIDAVVYSNFSVHLIHYPDKITNMCYTCSAMGDTSGFKSVASRMFKDIFIDVPTGIGGPIGEAITGIGHIFSFLNI